MGELHLSCQAGNMVHTLSHTEPLQCSADDMWEAVKYANVLLPTYNWAGLLYKELFS